MSMVRVTVAIPTELRAATTSMADELDTSFSAVVTDALATHVRGHAIDVWLAEFAVAHGAFTEAELETLAAEIARSPEGGLRATPPES